METQNLFTLEAETFNALAHPARLEILELLRQGECCVCHIQAMLDLRQAYISQHLNVLRRAALVVNRKDGLRVYYKVTDPKLAEVIQETAWKVVSTHEHSGVRPAPAARSPATTSR